MLDKMLTALGAGWVPYAIGLALLAGLFAYGYHLGADRTEATWTAKYATLERNYANAALAENTRRANANADAKAAEAVAIDTIDAQSVALQDLHRKLKDEASSDPTSTDDCLNSAARLRVNQVR